MLKVSFNEIFSLLDYRWTAIILCVLLISLAFGRFANKTHIRFGMANMAVIAAMFSLRHSAYRLMGLHENKEEVLKYGYCKKEDVEKWYYYQRHPSLKFAGEGVDIYKNNN